MRNLLSRLLGGISPTGRALRHAHEAAEKARLSAINRDPPPGNGWRLAPQDSEGKWTVWSGPRPMASFWDENEAAEWARRMNRDPGRPNPVEREDGKYCVNCRSHETDESLKARGYLSCCPERYVIPEAWAVTDKLATGQFHLWRPADGLPSVTDDSWADRADAAHEADHRNLLEFRNVALKPAALAGSPDAADALAFGLTAAKLAQETGEEVYTLRPYQAEALRELISNPKVKIEPKVIRESPPCQAVADEGGASAGFGISQAAMAGISAHKDAQARRLADFLAVEVPDGVRLVVGPLKSPQDGNWWTFDRSGPVRGYTRKTNAQAAAERANNAPQT